MREDGVGAGCEDEDVVGELGAVGAGYCFGGGVDLGYLCVDVVVKGSVGDALVLGESVMFCVELGQGTHPF